MNFLRQLKKKIKKRFRWNRRWLTLGIILLFLTMSPKHMDALTKQHPNWGQSVQFEETLKFCEYVPDLSADCVTNPYIGIDDTGHLTLFDGLPHDENAVHSFFQLQMELLESVMPAEAIQQLRVGLRVRDLDEYNSILSTYAEFAVESSTEVMMTK